MLAVAVTAALFGGAAGAGTHALLDSPAAAALGVAPSAAPNTTPGTVAAAASVAGPSTVDIRVRTPSGTSEGSGVILTADGAVLTNRHVVADALGPASVTLADGSQHAAAVVGESPGYDLAVLRLDGAGTLVPATLGRSAEVVVGQPVVAIGSPQGLTGTVTTGIISALNRTVAVRGEDGSAVVYNGLQTDAPINAGNSGGPLVDLQGHVIGINSAIATAGGTPGSIGLGFAIPVDEARRVAQEILDSGAANRPVLGVQGGPTRSGDGGATVVAVLPGSPAAAAGLAAGDTVMRVGDARVADVTDLVARISAHAPGETVQLTVRNSAGAQRTVAVTLGSTPDRSAVTDDTRLPSGLH